MDLKTVGLASVLGLIGGIVGSLAIDVIERYPGMKFSEADKSTLLHKSLAYSWLSKWDDASKDSDAFRKFWRIAP